MKIINAMFSKDRGGLEQAFLNYMQALSLQGNEVIPIIHPKAQILCNCPQERLRLVSNFNQYDFLAVQKLRKIINQEKPDCIITHNYRAAYLFNKTKTKVPKVAVCHVKSHYNFGTDAIIALTKSMRQDIILAGIPACSVFTVPNMIKIPTGLSFKKREANPVPVIGVCARFVQEKGIDIFIEALYLLKKRKIPFHAQIAGDGSEKTVYIKLIQQYQLQKDITLLGWLDDPHAFYEKLDIFCLPSREETFGLVILESMQHALPMVLTDLPGPREVIGNSKAAHMVAPNDPMQLARALEKVLQDKTCREDLSVKAYQHVFNYSTEKIGPILQEALENICKNYLS